MSSINIVLSLKLAMMTTTPIASKCQHHHQLSYSRTPEAKTLYGKEERNNSKKQRRLQEKLHKQMHWELLSKAADVGDKSSGCW